MQVRCTGYGFVEAYEGLKVALHSGGNAICSMGVLSTVNYVPATPSRADYTTTNGGYFVLATDFKTYSGKSGQLLQGANTLGSDLYFSANVGAMAAGAIWDFFLHIDFKLVIRDGILTVHV